jgi:hypothetical protein
MTAGELPDGLQRLPKQRAMRDRIQPQRVAILLDQEVAEG